MVRKATYIVTAMDLGDTVYKVARNIEFLTKRLAAAGESDQAFHDNHDLLNEVLHDITAIQHLRINEITWLRGYFLWMPTMAIA